ncbi:uncharacterized protein BT62DRAFT_552788 [Guyanagaster necrorhizus]|uniref:GST N-terminal domain-containing protein n=1 Tax=Guyanagaster necrorhizus TaxID=856835 RepID=A0A9P7VID0_9AGAR|nr:uncharacterized protein BT62DRAFT_552788 [Guyanagaster necrorhizus MCA 3950]KAG7441167.1 hypothetical protein BT62DRAFT_552788 [Guyanagaster necrorhizus MCA 3950]
MITLFDLPTKDFNSPGTLNTWRTKYAYISLQAHHKLTSQCCRYALNLKNLPYRTVCVELPDVEALAKRVGAAPTRTKSDGVSPFYTIPIIQDDSTGAVVSDSPAIAAYLDKTYPSSGPVLILTGTMTPTRLLKRSNRCFRSPPAILRSGNNDKHERGDGGVFLEDEAGPGCQG